MSDRDERERDPADDWFSEGEPPAPEAGGDDAEPGAEPGPPTSEPAGADDPLVFDPEEDEDSEARARAERRAARERRRGERSDTSEEPGFGGRLGGALSGLRGAGGRRGRGEAEAGDAGAEATGAGARSRSRRAPSAAVIRRRRIIAGGGVLIVLLILLVVAIGALGGGDEPEPVAEAPTTSLTIPEGLDREQIATLAKEGGVRGNYKSASKRSNQINLRRYGAEDAPSLEGFLFPATYELEENARAKQLVARQLDAFEREIKKVNLKEARSRNLTTYDVLKIASMIEREVMVPSERRKVAAVIYNRLRGGEPLGIDSTIRFEDSNYDKQLTEERLATDSPYNTRTRVGLPPTPIGNPGLAAIKAAANPANSDARFFVIKPGTCGEHVFTASDEEFQQAAARYQRALEREGGSPTDCPE